jgi:hypothetical protein
MKIEIGGVYANEKGIFAREVLGIDGANLSYRDFVLADGEPLSSYSRCSVLAFRRWAKRACTSAESALLRRDEPIEQERRFISEIVAYALWGHLTTSFWLRFSGAAGLSPRAPNRQVRCQRGERGDVRHTTGRHTGNRFSEGHTESHS